MQPTIPEATNIKAENEEGTQFSAEINGKRWSGITTDHEVIPAHEVEVTKNVTDHETSEVVEAVENIQVPERIVWANRMGEWVQRAIEEGAEVEPYVAPPAPNPALAELSELDKSMPRGAEDLYDALIAKGIIVEADMNPYAVAKIKRKKELRG